MTNRHGRVGQDRAPVADIPRKMAHHRWKTDLALVLIVAALFIFGGLANTSFLDPDEGMYGSIAREMAETGDWLTPRFNGVRYLNKPPLYFWLTGLTMYLLGPSEWGVRLWSALPALGVALLIWHLGELLYGGRAGLLSALVFVSSVGVFRYVRVAATDFLLVFSITLAIYGFVRAALSQSPRTARRWSVVFWLGMALGVLSKGLVGLIFPLLIVGLYLLVNSKWQIVNDEWPIASGERRIANGGGRRLFASPLGILLFLALVLPWHLLAALKNPGFFQFYIVDNQLLRFFNRRGFIEDDVPVSTLAFLGLTLVWFFPWSLLLPASLRCGFPRLSLTSSLRERLRLVVGLWAVVVLGFFSLSSSKLEHYVLPAVPPLSLWVGALWSEVLEGRDLLSAGKWRFLGLGWWLGISALGCGLAGVGLFWFSHLLTPQMLLAGLAELNVYYRILQGEGTGFPFASVLPFVGLLKVLGVALAVGLPAALVVYRFRLPALSFAAFLATAGVIYFVIAAVDVLVEPHHSTVYVARALAKQAAVLDAIVHAGSLEYSAGLPFYTDKKIYVWNGTRGSLDFGSSFKDGGNVFLDDTRFAHLWNSPRRVFLVVPYQESENRHLKLPMEKLFLLGEFGSRRLYVNQRMIRGTPISKP